MTGTTSMNRKQFDTIAQLLESREVTRIVIHYHSPTMLTLVLHVPGHGTVTYGIDTSGEIHDINIA